MIKFSPNITSNTLVDYPRLEKLSDALTKTASTPGIIAEVGVYKGGTAYLLCEHTAKTVVLFDTFEGMPKVSTHDLHHEKDFNDTSLEKVSNLLSTFNNKILVKGIFPQNSQSFENCKFSLVHLDCDIYQSVKDCLEWFYPRMSPGGIIILDDYNEVNCPGAKLATDEFLSDKPEELVETVQSQAMITKL